MEIKSLAHNINKKARTSDVLLTESIDFSSLMLSSDVSIGLKNAGFERPSPIQLKAIPIGRCGLDLIVQAKSGTGKTIVFTVVALEGLILSSLCVQVLVLAPTREIALQISEVIKTAGSAMSQLEVKTFIGGRSVKEDIENINKCHIAVGTPGRIKQLINDEALPVNSIRLFVLDEADKLLEMNFQSDINWIYSSLPDSKQMIALSATYPDILAEHLTKYMRNPTFVRLNSEDPSLLGIRQYAMEVEYHPLQQKVFDTKVEALVKILSQISFNQCLVFSNFQLQAQSLNDVLKVRGWPTTFISGNQDQEDRIAAIDQLKELKCRILVTTDLTSRGIDAEHVNLIVNFDVPNDHDTYLHRIGRAGRFGSYGAAISLMSGDKEGDLIQSYRQKCNTTIAPLPDPIPRALCEDAKFQCFDELFTVEHMKTHAVEDYDENSCVAALFSTERCCMMQFPDKLKLFVDSKTYNYKFVLTIEKDSSMKESMELKHRIVISNPYSDDDEKEEDLTKSEDKSHKTCAVCQKEAAKKKNYRYDRKTMDEIKKNMKKKYITPLYITENSVIKEIEVLIFLAEKSKEHMRKMYEMDFDKENSRYYNERNFIERSRSINRSVSYQKAEKDKMNNLKRKNEKNEKHVKFDMSDQIIDKNKSEKFVILLDDNDSGKNDDGNDSITSGVLVEQTTSKNNIKENSDNSNVYPSKKYNKNYPSHGTNGYRPMPYYAMPGNLHPEYHRQYYYDNYLAHCQWAVRFDKYQSHNGMGHHFSSGNNMKRQYVEHMANHWQKRSKDMYKRY